MTGEPDWVPPGVDTRRANIARLYDYLLGGSHNFLADQDLGRALAAVEQVLVPGRGGTKALLVMAARRPAGMCVPFDPRPPE